MSERLRTQCSEHLSNKPQSVLGHLRSLFLPFERHILHLSEPLTLLLYSGLCPDVPLSSRPPRAALRRIGAMPALPWISYPFPLLSFFLQCFPPTAILKSTCSVVDCLPPVWDRSSVWTGALSVLFAAVSLARRRARGTQRVLRVC